MLKFDNYPESCPPVEAMQFDGVFFRLCKGESFCEEDFMTHFEAGKNFPDKKLCEAMALSFYDNYEQAENLKKRFRKKFGTCSILPVKIIEDYGVGVLEEKSGHLNLWERRNVDIFADLMKEEKGKDE
ncbi:hypothetical protein [Enterococcus casseliflavus]|uniref:hypothetical protein n=1 Tax=Enterococcus casseliflavus TaxID=37734 RepID=UPI00143315A9|nr:hypothetical protein [Enterococcus casseliflavus]NKD33085.1 hypothetical protein [Enterococcus casseliflavus]